MTAPPFGVHRRALCLWAVGLTVARGQAATVPAAITPPGEAAATPMAAAVPALVDDAAVQPWQDRFSREVDHLLDVPPADQQRYIQQLQQALATAALPAATAPAAQCVVLVDRSPQVQAAMVLVQAASGGWHWLGATAVATGKPGTFAHFRSPLGVFAHTLANPDFRAQGTFNKNHIRGYGLRGRRVFDFGWQQAERGWGAGGSSQMRLQMHATDPRTLEPRLGRVGSEGCIRIPATLNVFLDRHGILDADYLAAVAQGHPLWVLKPDRQPLPWPGRYLVIVDSQASVRPAWSPLPGTPPAPVATALRPA